MASERTWPWEGAGSMIPASQRTETMVEEILRVVDRIEEKLVDAAPTPTVPLPEEVEAAIRAIIDGTNTEDMGTHDLDYWLELSGVVMDWLDTQGKDAP